MSGDTGASRFTFHSAPPAAPGKCLISGAVKDVVDTGISLQYYGAVYLNRDVIRELAEVAGILEAPIEAELQHEQWRQQGYAEAVKDGYDASLRDLISELSAAADRLERVQKLAEPKAARSRGGKAPVGAEVPAAPAVPSDVGAGSEPAGAADSAPVELDNPFASVL